MRRKIIRTKPSTIVITPGYHLSFPCSYHVWMATVCCNVYGFRFIILLSNWKFILLELQSGGCNVDTYYVHIHRKNNVYDIASYRRAGRLLVLRPWDFAMLVVWVPPKLGPISERSNASEHFLMFTRTESNRDHTWTRKEFGWCYK